MGLSFLPGLYVNTTLGRGSSVKAVDLHGRALYPTIGLLWRDTLAPKLEFEQLAQHIHETVKRSFFQFAALSG